MSFNTIMISISRLFLCFDGIAPKLHHKNSENSHVIYPMGTPRMPHLQCCQRFAVNYYGFTFGAPGRLALPVRHRLRLRRMPGGLGWRAGLQWQAGLVPGARFQDTAQDTLVGAHRGGALIHPGETLRLPQTHYPFQPKAVLGKNISITGWARDTK